MQGTRGDDETAWWVQLGVAQTRGVQPETGWNVSNEGSSAQSDLSPGPISDLCFRSDLQRAGDREISLRLLKRSKQEMVGIS